MTESWEPDEVGNPPIPAEIASEKPSELSRRRVLSALAGLGIGSTVFQRAVAAQADRRISVTAEMIQQAEWIAGLELDEDDRQSTARAVNRVLTDFEELRGIELDNSVPPALAFHPAPFQPQPVETPARLPVNLIENQAGHRPDSTDDLAFLPVSELAPLLRTRQVSSVELTQLYLQRLRTFDPILHCVVTETEQLALKQAERADREIRAGNYRGPLHGIPWGAKDLIAYPGYKTTWGATPFKDQEIATKATVAKRLEEAGAVLVAKLALGALASGDRWFGKQTRNPWNPQEGSSGSSAGSAAATAAGLVGFAIGSETLGSIVSPSRRCGTTGLRPTFGRVSRYGCMTLSWSMDKLGPITRSVQDCALIFAAIHGSDGLDPSAIEQPFGWPVRRDLRTFRVGYVEDGRDEQDRPELGVLRELGVKLTPIRLPNTYPLEPLRTILYTEAATVFDEITRQGITEDLNSWPSAFRWGQFVPAVEYLRANRVRTLVMREMHEVMSPLDAYVGGDDLVLANLTGHPTVVLPNGFTERNGATVPTSLTFTGNLYGESELLALAHAYQQATDFHFRRPPIAKWLAEHKEPTGKPPE